jgi:uncharacterized membrane protein YfcA
MEHVVVAIVIGLVVGLLSGLFGVGGSSIATPLLRVFLGTSPLIALASPLPVTLPVALSGTIAYQRHRLISRRVVAWTAAGGMPAVILGSVLTRWVPGHWLMLLVAAAMLLAGWQILRPSTSSDSDPLSQGNDTVWQHPPVAVLLAVAVVAGLLSGLLAIGGGLFLIPAFILLLGAEVREAAATSLACVAFLALPGTVTHALLGHIDWWLSLQLGLAVIPATYLGARLSLRLTQIRLRRLFGVFLLAFAVYFFVRELIQVV